MESDAIENAREYAAQYQLRLAERLGFGVHGIIFVAEHTLSVGKTAVKAHHSIAPYFRERAAYQRLLDANVSDILGFHVPHLVQFDDDATRSNREFVSIKRVIPRGRGVPGLPRV